MIPPHLIPRTMTEYGSNAATKACLAYLKEPSGGLVLQGAPGSGKTCLVRCLANDSGAALVEVCGEIDFEWLANAMQSRSLEDRWFFFDEVDSLTKPQQRKLGSLIEKAKMPVFLACNEDLGADLKGVCKTVRMPAPSRAQLDWLSAKLGRRCEGKSFRQAILQNDIDAAPEPDEVISTLLQGGKAELKTEDHWRVYAILLDSTEKLEPLEFDRWASRVRKAPGMGKYATAALRLRIEPKRPWSLRLR